MFQSDPHSPVAAPALGLWRRCGLLAALMTALLVCGATAARAQVYQSVVVQGAELVPEEDIARTCGELTGIEIDEITRRAVEDCLMTSGVFSRVSVIPQGDTLVIDVTEIETRPGRLDVGLVWESDTGPAGTLSYRQSNLIPDSTLSLHSSYAKELRLYDVNFLRSDAFGPGLHFGFQLRGERAAFDDLPYHSQSDQLELYAAWVPRDGLRVELGLGYRHQRLMTVAPGASALLHGEEGRTDAPYLHLVASRSGDAAAQTGYELRLDQYLWNLGSDKAILDTRLEARLRHDLSPQLRLLAGVKGVMVNGLDGYAPTALDRAWLGGESLRGFAPRGIGPRDRGHALGGTRSAVLSLELQRALTRAFDTEFRGGAFIEAGSLWGLDQTLGGAIDDRPHLRGSIGLSLGFDIGQVPVALYLARPVIRRDADDEQLLGLSASARF